MQLLNVEPQPNKSHKAINHVLEETRIETGRCQQRGLGTAAIQADDVDVSRTRFAAVVYK